MIRSDRYKKIKKDYQMKNLHNPFFHKKPAGKGWLKRWLIPAVLVGGAILAWFFLAAPFWQIQHIELKGLTRIPPGAVETMIWAQSAKSSTLVFSQQNIFLFDSETAEEAISTAYNLTGCTIEKKWPRTLAVTGYERPYAFIWQEGSNLFYASGDGYIIKDQAVSEEDKKKYFILENKNPDTLINSQDKINISDDYLNFILDLHGQLSDRSEALPLEKFMIDWEFNTVKAKFQNGPEAYFNTREAAAGQVERLLLVKNEKIKDNFSRTDYIDLRYGDRIFIHPDFK